VPLDDLTTSNFEDCESNSQRLAFLRKDLSLIEDGQPPHVFRLSQYEQFLADAISVLYARFSNEYRLLTFLHAAFAAGDLAVLSLCFSFPHCICNAFHLALARNSTARLLCCLCGLSPFHRPILLPKLSHLPFHFALLSLRFFPDESHLILTSTLETGVPGTKEELVAIRRRDNPSHLFWLCYARCCASDASMTERDVELFEYCHDDRLLVHLIFSIENASSKVLSDFCNRFQRTPSTMQIALGLLALAKAQRMDELSSRIRAVLGDRFEFRARLTFSDHMLKVLNAMSIQDSWFGKGTTGLAILGSLIDSIPVSRSSKIIPDLLNTVETVDISDVETIDRFLAQVVKADFPNIPREYRPFIDNITVHSRPSFQREAILDNCCRAVIWLIFILSAEAPIQPLKDVQIASFALINTLPLKFVLNRAYYCEGCSSVYSHLCKLAQQIAPHVFCQPSLMTHKPRFLAASCGDSVRFLRDLANSRDQIDESVLWQWKLHWFMMPFQYVTDTIVALGGPRDFALLHEVWDFPLAVLRNAYALRIITACLVDLVAFWDKLFQMDGRPDRTAPELLIVSKAINLLRDPFVDISTIGNFLNSAFVIMCQQVRFFEEFLLCGFDYLLIPKVVESVPFCEELWQLIAHLMKQKVALKSDEWVFIFQFAAHLAVAHRSMAAHGFFREFLIADLDARSRGSLREETFPRVVDALLCIVTAFPEFADTADCALQMARAAIGADGAAHRIKPIVDAAQQRITAHLLSATLI
jgi:hypothetical protein